MDVREKLVELLEPYMSGLACEYESGSCELTSCRSCNAKNIADHLIANGVTVQEWISVEDRLPEPFVSVLACIPSEEPLPTVHESYIADHGAWVCILTAERYKTGEVTHWMPLPEPPKGE